VVPEMAPEPQAAPAPVPAPQDDLPNREFIQAVLDGKTVQWQRPGNDGVWDTFLNRAFAIQMLVGYGGVKGALFRVKPEDTA
jgi:hypothetical protein